MGKTLVVGDLHFKEKLSYADFVVDGRVEEKKKILKYILKLSKDCDKIVFLGDQLNGRNNPSEVIREFVEFVESFGDKKIYIIGGNHEKSGDGKSAIDFMREVNKKNWTIITDKIVKIKDDVFCPYFYKGELGANDYKKAVEKILEMLPDGKNLFIHHALSGYSFKNMTTDSLNEIVLPKAEVKKKFKNVFCGHIHSPGYNKKDKIVYAGSVFTSEINEDPKFVYIFDGDKVEQFPIPGRQIIKLENPTTKDLEKISKDSIVKVVLSKKIKEADLSGLKKALSKFDGFTVIEDFRTERRVIKYNDQDLDLNICNLLEVYSKDRKVNLEKLKKGYDLIK